MKPRQAAKRKSAAVARLSQMKSAECRVPVMLMKPGIHLLRMGMNSQIRPTASFTQGADFVDFPICLRISNLRCLVREPTNSHVAQTRAREEKCGCREAGPCNTGKSQHPKVTYHFEQKEEPCRQKQSKLQPRHKFGVGSHAQCADAFSDPNPVFARTSSSVNFASELSSTRLIIVPMKAPINPRGILTIPGFSSGNNGFI